MTVAINNTSRPESDFDKIIMGLNAATQAFKVPVDIETVQHLMNQNSAFKNASDPNSAQSKAEQQDMGVFLDASAKYAPDQDSISSLKKTIFGDGTPKNPGLSAAEIENMKASGYFSKFVTGEQSAQAMANKMAPLVAVKQGQLNETLSKDAGEVGQKYESDPIIQLSKTNLNSLTRSQNILTNPNKPVLQKDLNLAYNDYINAVAAGGAATEGKISRELPDSWALDFNNLKAKAGEFEDLRQSPTGAALINMLGQNISTVRSDINNAIKEQALNIYSNNAASTNQLVQQINKSKLQKYNPEAFDQLFGSGGKSITPQAPKDFTPPPLDLRSQSSGSGSSLGASIIPSANADQPKVPPPHALGGFQWSKGPNGQWVKGAPLGK